jgi:hypothetical protein
MTTMRCGFVPVTDGSAFTGGIVPFASA